MKQEDGSVSYQESTCANGFNNNFTQTHWILFDELPQSPTTSAHGT